MKGGNKSIAPTYEITVNGFNEAALHEGRKSALFASERLQVWGASMRPPFMKGGNFRPVRLKFGKE